MKKRYLIVDAYNVIHAIKELREVLDKSPDGARDQLAERAMAIHDVDGIHTVLVFDGCGESLEVIHSPGRETFELVYAPAGTTADGIIEKLLTRIAEPGGVTVASDDAMIRESARVNGAIAISSEDLFNWICICEQRLVRDVERRRKMNEKEWHNRIQLDGGSSG